MKETENTIDLASLTPEEFIQTSEDMLKTVTMAILENISHTNKHIAEFIEEDGFDSFVEVEQDFMRAVLKGFERWSKDSNNVVLWDIDDTLGKIRYLKNEGESEEKRVWFLRPAMQILIPYIIQRYPEFQHSFLTSRGAEGIVDDMNKYPDLFEKYPFFNYDLAYSVKGVYVNTIQHGEIVDQFRNQTNGLNIDFARKYLLLEDLKKQNPNNHYRIIDDNAIAKVVGEDGVYVQHLQSKMG